MLTIQNLSYTHPNREILFNHINLSVNSSDKAALLGNNGVGKSTLLKIISGELHASGGRLHLEPPAYYIPQLAGQYNHLTVAEALRIETKRKALHAILSGSTSAEDYEVLNNDWTIEERCQEALRHWQLDDVELSEKMGRLSGGQKTKVFLAGIHIHQPKLILMDEPSNHLDRQGRHLLYDFVRNSKQTLIIVSHDRKLLNLLNVTYELSADGVTLYGGNYDFYQEQKTIAVEALYQHIHSKERVLKKARDKARETRERQQRADSRGKRNLKKAGLPKIVANTLRNNAENSTAKANSIHAEKTEHIQQDIQSLRASRPETDKMSFEFDHSKLHRGKNIFTGENLNFAYPGGKYIWDKNLNLRVKSGERIAFNGTNGSGKTTLINLILGHIEPKIGSVYRADYSAIHIDQDYTLINNGLKISEQAQQFNTNALPEHVVNMKLSQFLFGVEDWNKYCGALSGGERMRLILCCLNMGNQAPDTIVLDEPTNNLDIQNIEILTEAIKAYQGTLLAISHDETFLSQINIERTIELGKEA